MPTPGSSDLSPFYFHYSLISFICASRNTYFCHNLEVWKHPAFVFGSSHLGPFLRRHAISFDYFTFTADAQELVIFRKSVISLIYVKGVGTLRCVPPPINSNRFNITMPPSTPWTQRSKGHLVSDRIQPQTSAGGSKTAAQKQSSTKHQSPEVNHLQKLISYLQNPASLPKSENEEGCFCLAQVHKISPYTPLCMSCGLILCDLNQPYRACPFNSCRQALLAPQARAALITALGEKIAITIAEEENMRRKEEEDRRRAAGAFPQLGPGVSSPTPTKPISSAPHKILSLTQKGAILTTVRKTPTPPPTRPFKVDTTVPVSRIPPPPQEPVRFPATDVKGDWQSVRSTRMVYVPPPQAERSGGGSKLSKKARRRQQQAASEDSELRE
jgi:hypothetical protein